MVKKIVITLFLISLTKFSYSQLNLYSDSLKVSDSTILVATSTKNKQFEFCISKATEIKKELKKLSYGPEKESSYEKFPVAIKLVTKGKISKIWNVRPTYSVIDIEGKKYLFDTSSLSILHKKYPIEYIIEEKIFTSEEQQNDYYLELLKDIKFLYIVPHDFENEWIQKFNLKFTKNETFSSPAAISKYLDSLLLKHVSKEKYSISYSPTGEAKNDSANEFTMTIYSMANLYESINDKNAVKGGLYFYPTYVVRKS